MGITMTISSHGTVLDDLPEWIVIEEILVRLPPKDVLRCRAVRKLWRSATSTDKFMLDNCRHQPLLPVIRQRVPGQEGVSFVIFRDDGAGAFNQKLWPIIQHSKLNKLLGTCDGLLILSDGSDFWICNPATRRCAPLPQPRVPSSPPGNCCIYITGFYRHHPSGEYHVLWFSRGRHRGHYRGYILTVGSDKPRIIKRPSVSSRLPEDRRQGAFDSCYSSQVNQRGCLHWLTGRSMETAMEIMVFDTVTETFRWMCSPEQLGSRVSLLEIDNKLASCSKNDAIIEIWVMQDYEAEAWALKHRINMLAMTSSPHFEYISKMVLINQCELLICCGTTLEGPDYLLRCDIDGKFLGYVEINGGKLPVYFTNQYIQESMIPLPFNEMQEEGGVDKEPQFLIGL